MVQWLGSHLRESKMRVKLLILFTVLILLPLILQGAVTYRHFSSTMNDKTEQYTIDIAGQVNANLDRLLKDLERLSLMPLYDEMVLTILAKYNGTMGSGTWALSDDYLKMKQYTSAQAYDRPEIRGIHLISNSGILFSSVDAMAIGAVWDGTRDEWFRKLELSDGEWQLIPPHAPSYYSRADRTEYISVARVIREPKTLEKLGYIVIDANLEAFGGIMANLNVEKTASLMIVDEQQELLYERVPEDGNSAFGQLTLHERLPQLASGQSEALNGIDYLFVRHHSAYSGLSVIGLTPIGVIQKESRELMMFTLWLALMCVAIAMILAVMMSYRMTRPLIELKNNMTRVEQGDFNKRVSPLSNDEFGQLGRGFNKMMDEINRLFHEVFVLGIREKEAELSALQSQINPHFIYNTLESINMMAVQRKHAEVSDMVSALGKLLRYTIDKAGRLVKLQEEIDFVDSYVRIQQVRYGGRLQVIYDIEEGLEKFRVPKLMIQPLVENAVYHGLDGREDGGVIWISALRFENELLITVRDNGKGMDEDGIQALNMEISRQPSYESLQRSEQDELGLHNICQRIKLLYGEGGNMTVDGSPGQGIAVTIAITLTEEGAAGDV